MNRTATQPTTLSATAAANGAQLLAVGLFYTALMVHLLAGRLSLWPKPSPVFLWWIPGVLVVLGGCLLGWAIPASLRNQLWLHIWLHIARVGFLFAATIEVLFSALDALGRQHGFVEAGFSARLSFVVVQAVGAGLLFPAWRLFYTALRAALLAEKTP